MVKTINNPIYAHSLWKLNLFLTLKSLQLIFSGSTISSVNSQLLGPTYFALGTGSHILCFGHWFPLTLLWALGPTYFALGTGSHLLCFGHWFPLTLLWALGPTYFALGTGFYTCTSWWGWNLNTTNSNNLAVNWLNGSVRTWHKFLNASMNRLGSRLGSTISNIKLLVFMFRENIYNIFVNTYVHQNCIYFESQPGIYKDYSFTHMYICPIMFFKMIIIMSKK